MSLFVLAPLALINNGLESVEEECEAEEGVVEGQESEEVESGEYW